MVVLLERIEDLFDERTVEEMLSYIGDEKGVCHWNAATIAREFGIWEDITYVEGYLVYDDDEDIGHAINCYTDNDGNKHYFDITQEKFKDEYIFAYFFDTVKEYTYDEIDDIFIDRGGKTSLVSVGVMRLSI